MYDYYIDNAITKEKEMESVFKKVKDLQAATMAARERIGDSRLGTRAGNGCVQIIICDYDKKGRSTITALSDMISIQQAIYQLNSMRKIAA